MKNQVQKRNKIDENIDKILIMTHKNIKKMSHRLILVKDLILDRVWIVNLYKDLRLYDNRLTFRLFVHFVRTGKLGSVSLAKIKSVVLFVNPKCHDGRRGEQVQGIIGSRKLTLLMRTIYYFKTSTFRDPLSPSSLTIVLRRTMTRNLVEKTEF